MIVLLAVADAVLWLGCWPAGAPAGTYLGQLFGAEAVLLLSIGLVLISTLSWVESWFDGIDRAAIWHRRVSIVALVLLVPHIMLSANPDGTALGGPLGAIGMVGLAALAVWAILPRWRSVIPKHLHGLVTVLRQTPGVGALRAVLGGYDRWRVLHRTAGLFVAAGFLHGLLDGTPFPGTAILRWTYVATGGVGVAFYLYRELLSRFVVALHDYQVSAVSQLDPGLVELTLKPVGRPVDFVPGQFAMVFLEAKDGWHRHPFTIASAPDEGVLRFTVKALGDYTAKIGEIILPGMPAVIGGPHGRFTHAKGTDRQVWIAGGVGVTPFLSWLRSFDLHPAPGQVDFFHTSSDGAGPFAAEIRAIVDRHETLRAHFVNTGAEGRLTGDRILATVDGGPRGLSVFLCGPEGMVTTLQSQLQLAGVSARNIHREYFDWR